MRITVWGSCVSRDTLDHLGSDCQLIRYVARQSWLSSGHDVTAEVPALPKLESQFQQRMSEGDLRGDALEQILEVEGETDLLLLDLCDERLGVVRLAGGGVLTRSYERILAGTQEILDGVGRVLALGEPEHQAAWRQAVKQVVARLDRVGLTDKALLLAPDWALLDERAMATRGCFGLNAVTANQRFDAYYRIVEESGLALLRLPGTLADSQHRWGPAAFHYHLETYLSLAAGIREFTARA